MIPQKNIDLIKEKFLSRVTAQATPTLHATCGIPGAGKSTFVDMKLAQGLFPHDAYILNPDRVMLALPDYQADVAVIGAQAAYRKWELPCRELAYAMADCVAEMRGNMIKDMGCANPLSLALVKRLKAKGYHIHLYHIDCTIEEAFRRIDQRAFRIAKGEVRLRHRMLADMLPEYTGLADEFVHLDNTDLAHPYQIAA